MTLAAATFSLRETAWRWPAAVLGLGVAPVLAVNGGFYGTSWGWSAAALGWAAALAACVRAVERPSRTEFVFLGGLVAYATWVLLSTTWGIDPGLAPGEFERTLVYVAAVLATIAVVRRNDVPSLLGGVAAGAALVCIYALMTRLYPGTFNDATAISGSRLFDPVGYWNGLGITASMALLLALGFVGYGRRALARAAASAAVPLCAATLYLTFSRGSSIALGVGLVVLFAYGTDRLRLAARVFPPVAASAVLVWTASNRFALTHVDAPLAVAIREGHSLVLTAVECAGAAAAMAYLTHLLPPALGLPERERRVGGGIVLALVLAASLSALVHFGGPVAAAKRGWSSFANSPISTTTLNSRLFSFGNDGRIAQWRVALHAFEAHPVGGIGAGGFADYWAQHRTQSSDVQDAHNLYLETLAEVGIVGLVLLAAALLAPLAALRRARLEPLAAGAFAAYAAFLVHAAADWDWELAGVSLVALFCAGGLVAAARVDAPAGRLGFVSIGLGVGVSVLAIVGLAGNLALARSTTAISTGNVSHAATEARRAHFWAPWSSAPLQLLGESQLTFRHDPQAAATFRRAIAKRPADESLWIDLAQATRGTARAAALARAHQLNPLDDSVAAIRRQLKEAGHD